jgi:gamma-glutamyltranspeptidase
MAVDAVFSVVPTVTSFISTANTLFGSRVIVSSTGVVMNNEMNDFLFQAPPVRSAMPLHQTIISAATNAPLSSI